MHRSMTVSLKARERKGNESNVCFRENSENMNYTQGGGQRIELMRIIQRKRNLLSRLILPQNKILIFDVLLAQLPFEPFTIFHQTQLSRAQFLFLIRLHQNSIDRIRSSLGTYNAFLRFGQSTFVLDENLL